MKKIFFLLVFAFLSFISKAQNAGVSAGGNATGIGGSVSYSIGQVALSFSSATNGSVSEGLQQTFEISTLGTNNFPNIVLEMTIYPNPTANNITLKISDLVSENFSYQLFDMAGKQIFKEKIKNSETSISLENLNASIYFLQVIDTVKPISKQTIKTFKIIKN
ncbi:T9SS type A sorting domain-containing protein [Flavobacterium sp.]|uniref:T9SS type A sorting domain-containing protein n=1 Tax=Flavobacterium sp. TaxID=239 RepID=UPI00286E7C9E|nr:T9SS type A sorting domain-containing protein [Flavobacterium sp.]